MGCLLSCFSRKDKNILIEYCIPSNMKLLLPHGKIIVIIDKQYCVPLIETNFSDYYDKSTRLWPKISTHSNHYLLLNKSPISYSRESMFDWGEVMALSIKPENTITYFGNVVCPFRANYLDNDSIEAFHTYFFEMYTIHNRRYGCYCFRCRIFRLLLEVSVGRQKNSNFILETKDHVQILWGTLNILAIRHIGFRPQKVAQKADLEAFFLNKSENECWFFFFCCCCWV